MSNFFPESVNEAASKMGDDWVKVEQLEAGITLQLAKPMEIKASKNPQYGAKEDNYLVKQNILEEGQTMHFIFNNAAGEPQYLDTNSAPFFIALKNIEELGVGDWIKIVRTGKATNTRYTISKVEAPVSPAKPQPDSLDDLADSVPF